MSHILGSTLRPALCLSLGLGLGLFSTVALGQDGDSSEETTESKDGPQPAATEKVEGATYKARRGWFVTGDLGTYFSFGGISTTEGFSSRTTSNVQPMVGVNIGYDIVQNPTLNFALALRGAMTFNAGSAPISQQEATAGNGQVGQTSPADFDMSQVGLGAKLGILIADRLLLNIIADAGAGFISPDPTEPALRATDTSAGPPNPNAGDTGIGFIGGAGAGLQFNTLFPGFSIGLETRFQAALVSSEFIPGLSITAPLKYTF